MKFDLGPRIDGDHHYALLEYCAKQAEGTALEFGTGNGTSTALIAERMPVVSFGSQFGLPEKWRDGYGPGSFAYPVPNIANAEIVEGWFDETLPGYDFAQHQPIGLCHIDCDLYSSTSIALRYAGPHLKSGCIVVFDETFGYVGHEEHELRAWLEFAEGANVAWSVVGHGVGGGELKDQATHEQWAIRIN